MLNFATTSAVSCVLRSRFVTSGDVHPQLVRTPTTCRSSLYMFRKTNRYSVFDPLATVPKLWLVTENILLAHSWACVASAAHATMSAATTT